MAATSARLGMTAYVNGPHRPDGGLHTDYLPFPVVSTYDYETGQALLYGDCV
jgi:hypothetical protein